jgi:hypothetical protein
MDILKAIKVVMPVQSVVVSDSLRRGIIQKRRQWLIEKHFDHGPWAEYAGIGFSYFGGHEYISMGTVISGNIQY